MRSSFVGFSTTALRRALFYHTTAAKSVNLNLNCVRCFAKEAAKRTRVAKAKKVEKGVMEDNKKDEYYVVRKGDLVAVYGSLTECQAQMTGSVSDPSVGVFKAHSLRKETKEYLASRGLRNALYSINAVDLKDDLFGTLVPCLFQEPDGLASLVDKEPKKTSAEKRPMQMGTIGSGSTSTEQPKKHPKLEYPIEVQPLSSKYMTCVLEFDGASKGNPGKAGAGAVLRNVDGSVVSHIRQGLGVVTNNVAEYRALILGLKYALKKGFKQIQVQGDSKLVCMQVQELWKTKNQNMADLYKEVKALKDMFLSFKISHVLRELNSDADAQANLAVALGVGEEYEEPGESFANCV